MIGRRRGRSGSETQSQSSICSTPGQSSASNKVSSDWPEPPDIPICSTEDEAASIYSDSGINKKHIKAILILTYKKEVNFSNYMVNDF